MAIFDLSGDSGWSHVDVVGPRPPVRAWAGSIYDPQRERMLIFGGKNTRGVLNDVWELSLSGTPQWTEVQVSGSPPPRRL